MSLSRQTLMQIGWSWYAFHLEPLSSLIIDNSLVQLRDVTQGLIYMHEQGIVHGDLKGVHFTNPVVTGLHTAYLTLRQTS
jgi:serine/threonine protein kinase